MVAHYQFGLSACCRHVIILSFFFNHTPTTEIYTLSLHDALPICDAFGLGGVDVGAVRELRLDGALAGCPRSHRGTDRKSTRLNSSHVSISYAVFCLKKKKKRVYMVFVFMSTRINSLNMHVIHSIE